MSRIVSIQTEIRDVQILQKCLEELDCQVLYQPEGIKMQGAHKPVQFLVHASCGTCGFRLTPEGRYAFVTDDMWLPRQQAFLQQLTRHYAYRKILKDANAAGYQLVHEEVRDDQTIKLVVRKW